MRTQDELQRQTLEVLGEDYLEYYVSKYTLTEDIEAGTAWIVCQLSQVGKGPLFAVEGKGVGSSTRSSTASSAGSSASTRRSATSTSSTSS